MQKGTPAMHIKLFNLSIMIGHIIPNNKSH